MYLPKRQAGTHAMQSSQYNAARNGKIAIRNLGMASGIQRKSAHLICASMQRKSWQDEPTTSAGSEELVIVGRNELLWRTHAGTHI